MSPARIAAYDRRKAAIHEAGHQVIAQWRGVSSAASVFPVVNPRDGEKTWVGRASFFSEFTPMSGRLIAVAGAVAEHCWQGRRDGSHTDCLEDWIWEDPAGMSDSDWAFARTKPGEPDHHFMRAVGRVHAALNPTDGKLWPELCRTSRTLIAAARPLNGRRLPYVGNHEAADA
jgi:hypothetical protein